MNSEDYCFEKGNLVYHDTYFGGRDFIGEEIVYKSKKPVWGANYFSFILNENVRKKDVYNFLRQALIQEYDDEIPVRRPVKFFDGERGYTFSIKGSLGNFASKEEISLNRRIVYRCFV